MPFIKLQMNTVVSVYNYLTLSDFYTYLIDKQLFVPTDWKFTLYNMSNPDHLSAHILPAEYKRLSKESLVKTQRLLIAKKYKQEQVTQLDETIRWIESSNTWEAQKEMFRSETNRLDTIREESFVKTFPELAGLMED